MRVEAYRPELPAERMAVRITAFITEAAASTPAFSKTSVNGEIEMSSTSLPSRWGLV